MNVQMPDGTVIEGVPDNVSRAEVLRKYQNTAAALNKDVSTEGELRFAGMDSGVHVSGKPWQLAVSVGRGMTDLWAGANQIALGIADKVSPRETSLSDLVTGPKPTREQEYTRAQDADLEQYKKIQNEAPVTTGIGRVAGQVAPTLILPAGAVSGGINALARSANLARFARAGVVTDAVGAGSLQGAMNFVPEGESRLTNTLESGAVAGGMTKGLQLLARTVMPKSTLPQMAGTTPAMSSDDLANSLKTEGIDWWGLPNQLREGIAQKANDAAKAGAPVSPAEIARYVRAQNLPGGAADLTKGQMTQDRTQLRNEFNMRRTAAGQTLDQQLVAQDEALANSLDVIKLKTGGTTVAGRDAETGQKITQPLLDQLQKAQGKVDALYQKADESGATLETVDPAPLVKWLEDNFAAQHSAPAMKSLAAQLKRSGLVEFTKDGEGITAVAGRQPTIREMESLRQAMNQWGKGNDASGHWMSEAKRVVDGITEGKGGDLYAQARQARIDLRTQFEDPGIINRLVSEKPGGDRVTAFEDVFRKTVLNGSVDDLTALRGQLLQPIDKSAPATAKGAEQLAGNVEGRASGVQAYKDLRSATLDYIKLGALNNASGDFSYAGFKKAVESIGPEKLEVLFGKNTTNEILSTLQSAQDMKAVYNKAGIYNSGTASALIDWLDKLTGLVGMGKAASYTTSGAKKVWEGMRGNKLAAEATRPMEAAYQAGASAKDAQYKEIMNLYAGRAGVAAAPGAAAAVSAPDAGKVRQ